MFYGFLLGLDIQLQQFYCSTISFNSFCTVVIVSIWHFYYHASEEYPFGSGGTASDYSSRGSINQAPVVVEGLVFFYRTLPLYICFYLDFF